MKYRSSSHKFALYVADLDQEMIKQGQFLDFEQQELVHRISRVLRLDQQDSVVIFNHKIRAHVLIEKINKHSVLVQVLHVEDNVALMPHITVYLSLLKREALEQAIYSAVELGANEIKLVLTAKVQRKWQPIELDRLHHVMIAAAEQSKNFSLPMLHEPVPIMESDISSNVIFFDQKGIPLADWLQDYAQKKSDSYMIFIGPEGDLTDSEKFYLQQRDVLFVRLTPTILRAQQAASIGLGVLRSIFY